MKNNPLKALLKATWFRDGTRHRIRFGPMKGLYFRTNDLTGISPWYSGPERDHQHLFASLINPGDCVFDIGANWGSHTLYFAKLAGAGGTVHAFEPLPEVMAELEWHVGTNDLKNVTPHQVAVSNENGTATFIRSDLSETSHLEDVDRSGPGAKTDGIEVQVRTLDSVCGEINPDAIHLMKIDVEGAESKVLEGGSETIQKFLPHLIVDLHTPEQDLKVAAALDGWGYSLSRVGGGAITRIDEPWPHPEGVWGTIHATPDAGK